MFSILVWLLAFSIAILGGGLLAIELILCRHGRLGVIASTCGLAGLFLWIGADLIVVSPAPADRDWIVVHNFIMLAAVSCAVTVQICGCWWLLRPDYGRWKRASLGTMLFCQVTAAVWIGWRYHWELHRPADKVLQAGIALEQITGQALLTDKQRLVPVFRAQLDGDLQAYFELDADQPAGPSIQRASRDARSNCHGWVFAGGEYFLRGPGVKMILEDNGYELALKPQPGDVIVYRGPGDEIVHTGLVQTVFDDGHVLVESKWGVDGTFVHLAEDQPYTQSFAFYRRLRAGGRATHLVQAVTVLPGNFVLPRPALAGQPRSESLPGEDNAPGSILPEERYPIGAE